MAYDFEVPPPWRSTGVSNGTDVFYYSADFIRSPLMPLNTDQPFTYGALTLTPVLHRTAPPPASEVDPQPGLSLLWAFTGRGEYSYGHCMLSDW